MQREIFLKKIELTGCPYGEAEKYRLDDAESPAVWLTDDADTLEELQRSGACAVYVLTPENRDVFCAAAEWCVEMQEDAADMACAALQGNWPDMEFLWRVWLRRHGLPWQICETERLYLREMTEGDLDFLYLCQQDEQSARFVAGPRAGREEELEKIRAYRKLIYGFYGFGLWIVCEKEGGRPVGRAGLQLREGFETPELGFEIEASCRGQGYAREALEAVIRYSGEVLEFETLRSVVDAENTASRRLCESLGFAESGGEPERGDGAAESEDSPLAGNGGDPDAKVRRWIFYEKQL